MSLRLTPEILVGAYEFLRACPPFAARRLPEADEIEFAITRHRDRRGHWCLASDGGHRIVVSEANVGHTETLIRTIAHEMIHLLQRESGTETAGAEHNAEFKRLARLVCLYHGFDPRTF